MGAFLDFTGSGNAQIVAGFSAVPPPPRPTTSAPKPYQVALAIPTGPNAAPDFGTELPQFEGNCLSQQLHRSSQPRIRTSRISLSFTSLSPGRR